MRLCLLAVTLSCLALAQRPVTIESGRRSETNEVGNYLVDNQFEVGYRLAAVGGDHDLYRASVNYGNGMRLFNGRLRMDSADGKGIIDSFSLRSTGAATDPYQMHAVEVDKSRVFRYRMEHRVNQYHNRLPMLWRGEHGLRTERSMQSHDLTLRPGTRFEVLLGLDLNRRTGPGFASEGIADRDAGFDARNFLRFRSDLRQRNRLYRAGFSAKVAGLALTVIHAVDLYEEGGESDDAAGLPTLATNVQPVQSLARSEPFHGRTPFTTMALRTSDARRIGLSARYVYSGGYRNSTLMQDLTVPDPAASASTIRNTFVVGDANRIQSSGDLTVSVLPSRKWAVTNTTSFHNTRIEGQAAFLETGLFRNEFVSFEHLGIRSLTNATEANFRPVKQFGIYGAHRYSKRRIRSREAIRFADFGFGVDLKAVDNAVQAGAGGVRWMPGKGVRASFDVEAGRADRPLTPTSDRKFHNESARFSWRRKAMTLGGFYRQRANDNPTELLAYSSRSRVHGMQAFWTNPESTVMVDASYTQLSIDTATGILNLFSPDLGAGPERGRSLYGSNFRTFHCTVRANASQRVTLLLGASLSADSGADLFDSQAVDGDAFMRSGRNVITSLPVSYVSPQGRITVRLNERMSWNVGWQYYGYKERFMRGRGFRAHTGFSSLSVSF